MKNSFYIQKNVRTNNWLITYLDLLTLLLTLFVIMITYASFDEPELTYSAGNKVKLEVNNEPGYKLQNGKLNILLKKLATTSDAIDFKVLNGQVILQIQNKFLFNSGSAELLAEHGQVILDLERIIRLHNGNIRIEGHADDRPIQNDQFPSNWELSYGRALSIAKYLIDAGFDETRFIVVGFGSAHPINTGSKEEDLEKNRRVNIVLEAVDS